MTSFVAVSPRPNMEHSIVIAPSLGSWAAQPGVAVGRIRLPNDPVGSFGLTLTNVVVGSAYRLEVQSTGALVVQGTAGASTLVLAVDVFGPGSPLNDLRIKVRKGTAAPYYKDYETLATAVVGAQSIYVAQIPD